MHLYMHIHFALCIANNVVSYNKWFPRSCMYVGCVYKIVHTHIHLEMRKQYVFAANTVCNTQCNI